MRARLAAVLLLAAACGDAATPPDAQATATRPANPASVDPALLSPLTALGPCPSPAPADAGLTRPEGLYLPPGAAVTKITETGPLTNVQGYVGMTPIQIRVDYASQDSLEVLQLEDEGFESEALLTDGEHRLFIKAQAICDQGSVFAAVLAPENAAAAVPVPTGAATPAG